ncbi:hypothetical protein [Streptomyces sp. NPDC096132]|uniref:hypothetical protein n=1 Tax=Streptomyces sp. NPDC096132 TaxID=3366075 RepID=UPI0037F36307
MAFIGHRCACGHNDLNHTKSDTGKQICTAKAGASCGKSCKSQSESEVMPTFDRRGLRIKRVIAPGDGLETESGSPVVRTCACDACQALYEQLAPAA